METKLTLKLNATSIQKAKLYIRNHKGKSLSKLVEHYFDSLTSTEPTSERRLPPIVAGLAGKVKNNSNTDVRKEYTEYLIEKYR